MHTALTKHVPELQQPKIGVLEARRPLLAVRATRTAEHDRAADFLYDAFPSAVFRRSLRLASLSDAIGQANTLEMNILVSMLACVSEPQS